MSERLRTDVTIVGTGVAGLWTGKNLVDMGVNVTMIEKSDALANGATTRNEGWLHAGTYHSVAITNPEDAARVSERTVYGHDEIVSFAPEAIDHEVSYALSGDPALTDKIFERWDANGITYQQLRPKDLPEADKVNINRIDAAFRVKDKSVNSAVLCRRLATHIIARGGNIITNANFTPEDETTAHVAIDGYDSMTIKSGHFVLAAGAGLNGLAEMVTGRPMHMRYFQAHLLVTPRLTRDNYFYMDVGEAGVMNHQSASIIGINRDGLTMDQPSYTVNAGKEQLVHDAIERMLPGLHEHELTRTVTIACCKPDVYASATDEQSLNVQIFDIAPGYTCTLPGKMTESPYLGRAAALHVLEKSGLSAGLLGNRQSRISDIPAVTLRPADRWMQLEQLREAA